VTFSITPDLEETAYNQLLPSFAYPPALLEAFGSGGKIEDLFKYLSETFLSTRYQTTRNWLDFLQQNTTAQAISTWMDEIAFSLDIDLPAELTAEPSGKPSAWLAELFSAEPETDEDKETWQHTAEEVVEALISISMYAYPRELKTLGLPHSQAEANQTTPYPLAQTLLPLWQTQNAFDMQVDKLCRSKMSAAAQEFFRFCVRAILYKYNLEFSVDLRKIFE
jgi:hypothetical protein